MLTGVAGELCLEDGVPEESRSYILDDLGATIPIGVLKGSWPVSDLLTDILLLMVQEGLGFHAAVHPTLGTGGLSSIHGLGGCIDFDHPTHKRCQENETQVHVAVDAWIGNYAKAYRQFETDYPAISPVDLGSMGYAAEAGTTKLALRDAKLCHFPMFVLFTILRFRWVCSCFQL